MAEDVKNAEQKIEKASKAVQDEFDRTHKVPTGYSFNVRDGLHKTPKKAK